MVRKTKKEAHEKIIENRISEHPAPPLWFNRNRLLRGVRLRGALCAEHGSDRRTHSENVAGKPRELPAIQRLDRRDHPLNNTGAVAPFFLYLIKACGDDVPSWSAFAQSVESTNALRCRLASCFAAGSVWLRCACQGSAPSSRRLHLDNARSARNCGP